MAPYSCKADLEFRLRFRNHIGYRKFNSKTIMLCMENALGQHASNLLSEYGKLDDDSILDV